MMIKGLAPTFCDPSKSTASSFAMKIKLPHFLTEPGHDSEDEAVLASQGYSQSLKRDWVS